MQQKLEDIGMSKYLVDNYSLNTPSSKDMPWAQNFVMQAT
jgi:hypothetical protein